MMTPEQLLSRCANVTSLPAFVICFGDEPQRIMDSVDALVMRAKQLGFSEHLLLVMEQASDWELLWMHYQEQSLFASQRIIQVLFHGKINAVQSERLQAFVAQPNPDVMLVLRTSEMDKYAMEAKWMKAIDANGWVIQSKTLQGRALSDWLSTQVQHLGMSITPSALATLADWSQGNLLAARQSILRWQLQGIEQLTDECLASDQQDWARYDIFALSNALSSHQVDQALRIMERLQAAGEDIVLLLWTVARELRLWQTLYSTLAEKSWPQLTSEHRLWGDRAAALQRIMKQLTAMRLAYWQQQALTIDRQIKGQASGDAWANLRWLVADMVSLGQRLPNQS